MKKLLILALLLSSWNFVSASGIDWQRSLMRVEYEPETSESPDFNCFTYTQTPGIGELQYPRNPDTPHAFIAGCGSPYNGGGSYSSCVWEFLDVLGYSDIENNPPINNCFQQAGSYKTSIYLIDYANNVTGPDIGLFDIKPGPPDSETSTFSLNADCSDESLIANGSDTCTINFSIKDEFGNPVTQLKGETATIYSDSTFNNDANEGDYNFRSGTKVNGSVIPTNSSPTSFSIGNNDAVSSTFTITSWAPSMSKVGAYLGLTEPFNYAFHLQTPTVDASGVLDTINTVEFELGQYSPSIAFTPWVKSIPTLNTNPATFFLESETPVDLARNIVSAVIGGPNTSVNIFLTHHLSINELYLDGDDVSAADYSITFHGVLSDVIDIITTKQSTTALPILKTESAGIPVFGELGFSTKISYNISDGGTKLIKYPSGAVGNNIPDSAGGDDLNTGTTISTELLGASVEGKIIGEKDKQLLGDNKSIRLNTDSIEDIREEIFFNANKITRGLAPITTIIDSSHTNPPIGESKRLLFNTNWFNTHNIALIEDRDVVITGSINPPTGSNTLLIRNGNLIIRDDFSYNDKFDSFGIILINDEVAEKPTEGNIFVENDVKKIVGSIFAEGSIFTIPTGITGDVKVSDISNGHQSGGSPINETQLLFSGTLLTHNTLGGATLITGDTAYITPWDETSGILEADFDEAKKYDLHYMRAYKPKYSGSNQTNGDKCACEESGTCTTAAGPDCDSNTHATIIRYDGKVSVSPPPGFRESTLIKR